MVIKARALRSSVLEHGFPAQLRSFSLLFKLNVRMIYLLWLATCAWLGLVGAQDTNNRTSAGSLEQFTDWHDGVYIGATSLLCLFLVYLSLLNVGFLGQNMAYLSVGCAIGNERSQ